MVGAVEKEEICLNLGILCLLNHFNSFFSFFALHYWKSKKNLYPILSVMARDFFVPKVVRWHVKRSFLAG
jgi:hypothetical protein